MQTIHFTCLHCKNLMAVGANLLGRNVRCPHCKQVVQAPAANPNAAPAPAPPAPPPPAAAPKPPAEFPQFQLPPPPQESPDSIFGEVHEEDVFARPAPKPVIPPHPEPPVRAAPYPPVAPQPGYGPPLPPPAYQPPTFAPPPAPPPNFAWNEPTVPEDRGQQPAATWGPEPTAPLLVPGDYGPQPQPWGPPQPGYPQPVPAPAAYVPALAASNPWAQAPPGMMPEYMPRERADEAPRRDNRSRRQQRGLGPDARRGVSGLTWVLLVWALLATGGAIYLLASRTSTGVEHPFLSMPDFFGEFDKADRKKPSSAIKLPPLETAVPAQLRIPLGTRRLVGDHLEVEPVAIERRTVAIYQKLAGAEPQKGRDMQPVYVLRFKVKNTSSDVYFCPNDPAFNRRAANDSSPYNALIVGRTRFYGGPFPWPSRTKFEREYIEGQDQDHLPLAPGQERETVVCTFPGDYKEIGAQLKTVTEGPFLWRVQLRRGLVRCEDGGGAERDVSVTAVIGVEFKPSDVRDLTS